MKGAILVVEDSDDTRELLAELLMREGYHAVMARDGAEALRRMDILVPDLVITDLEMPGVDGAELIRQMAGREHLRSVPVCMLSGTTREHLAELKSANENLVASLRKPVKMTEFLDVVAGLLGKNA